MPFIASQHHIVLFYELSSLYNVFLWTKNNKIKTRFSNIHRLASLSDIAKYIIRQPFQIVTMFTSENKMEILWRCNTENEKIGHITVNS